MNYQWLCILYHRSSPLPFISIYNSKPDSGLVISDVAVQMLKESTDWYKFYKTSTFIGCKWTHLVVWMRDFLYGYYVVPHCTYRNVYTWFLIRTKIELSDYLSCKFYVLLLLSFSGVVLLLTPLFKYMFLHPLPSSEHAMVSSYLHSSLLSLAESMSVGKQRHQSAG